MGSFFEFLLSSWENDCHLENKSWKGDQIPIDAILKLEEPATPV